MKKKVKRISEMTVAEFNELSDDELLESLAISEPQDVLLDFADREKKIEKEKEEVLELIRKNRAAGKKYKKLSEMSYEEMDELSYAERLGLRYSDPEDAEKLDERIRRDFSRFVHESDKDTTWYVTDTGRTMGVVGGTIEDLEDSE